VALQLVGNLVNRQGLAEVVALNFVTPMCPQECHLRFVFDAFGNHLEMQTYCHADDCGCDRGVIGIGCNVSDKGTVDFELANSKLSQGGEVEDLSTDQDVYAALAGDRENQRLGALARQLRQLDVQLRYISAEKFLRTAVEGYLENKREQRL
jgi:hypothetical protein